MAAFKVLTEFSHMIGKKVKGVQVDSSGDTLVIIFEGRECALVHYDENDFWPKSHHLVGNSLPLSDQCHCGLLTEVEYEQTVELEKRRRSEASRDRDQKAYTWLKKQYGGKHTEPEYD